MATECLKITLHCVGVCVLSKEVGACMIMMETITPCGLYCVALTKETSDLVSPLYEHTLLIARQPLPTTITQDGNALIESFTGGAYCTVEERMGCRYRLDATYKHKELIKRMSSLIGNTLFLDIDCSYSGLRTGNDASHLLNPLMSTASLYAYWDCQEPEDCALLKKYVTLYHTIADRRYGGRVQKTLYERFWEAVSLLPAQKLATEKAVAALMAFTKHDAVYNKAALYNLLTNWKNYKPVASYFMHRFNSIIQTCALHKAFSGQPALLEKLWLMPCDRRIALHTFYCVTLKRLSTTTKEVPVVQDLVKHTLFQQELTGSLYALLSHFALTNGGEVILAMEKLKYELLTQCVIQRVEGQALAKTTTNKSTLDALSLSSIYFHYLALTSTATVRPSIPADTVFNMETGSIGEDSDSEDTMEVDPWASSLTDFGHFLVYFCAHIENTQPEQWLIKRQQSPPKAKSVLFFIAPRPALFLIDKDNARHYEEYLLGKEFVRLRFHGSEPVHPLTWQREWLEFKESCPDKQQYEFVLFTPLELMHNEDLACLLPMFMADIFNTSILRESSDVFFVKRLVHYYSANHHNNEISLSLFHKNHCFKSAHFHTIPSDAVKETVIVPQCHTFSLHGMQQLLRWCYFHRETVKRVVFLGSPFILPCLEHGAAFLDLLRAASPQQIKPLLYQKETRSDEFAGMLKKFWRAPKNTSLEQEQVLREGGCRVLFLMKNEGVFMRAFDYTIQRQIYCLTNRADGTSPLATLLKNRVENAKPKPDFNVLSITLDNLCLYNCLPLYTANDVFVIDKKTLFALEKNHLLYLFMLLEKLYVIEDSAKPIKGDFLQAMCDNFRERTKPNLRYSYIELDK